LVGKKTSVAIMNPGSLGWVTNFVNCFSSN
jgi:hypothetical protein